VNDVVAKFRQQTSAHNKSKVRAFLFREMICSPVFIIQQVSPQVADIETLLNKVEQKGN